MILTSEQKRHKVPATKFTYQIILSKGLGKLTRSAELMIIDLANNAVRRKAADFKCIEDKEDAVQTGLFNMLNMWYNFNPEKTDSAFNYFTEILKRGMSEAINTLYNKKGLKPEEQHTIKTYSIDRMNQGEGMHNL